MLRLTILACFLVAQGMAVAQDRKPLDDLPGQKKSEVFEEQEWYLATASGGVELEPIRLYFGPSRADAEKACTQWEEANKAARPNWIAKVKDPPYKVKVPVLRPTTPRTKPAIDIPEPKFVDPGSAKPAAKRAPSLKGKKVQGLIGNSKVTFEFSDKVIIRGERTVQGDWRLDGTTLRMETAAATYWGQVNEAGAAGVQFSKGDKAKDEKDPFPQWSFSLTTNADPTAKESGDPKDEGITYWAELRYRSQFNADGWLAWERAGYVAPGKQLPGGPFTTQRDAEATIERWKAFYASSPADQSLVFEYRVVTRAATKKAK